MLNRRDFCMSILAVPAITSGISLAVPVAATIKIVLSHYYEDETIA